MRMKENNKGYSVVELIVVIGIMAIMLAGTALSISVVTNSRATECAQNISSQLSETRSGSMSRADEQMVLAYKAKNPAVDAALTSDGFYTTNTVYTINKNAVSQPLGEPEIKKVGHKDVTVVVWLDGDTSGRTMDENSSLTISYDRSTGALENVTYKDATGSETIKKLSKIVISSGSRVCTITFIPETGKHTVTKS